VKRLSLLLLGVLLAASCLAAEASADSVLVVELESDFAAGTAVVAALTTIEVQGNPGTQQSASRSIVSTDDLLTGINVAEFTSAPSAEAVTVTVRLLDAGLETFALQAMSFFNTDVPKIIRVVVTSTGGRLVSETEYWTEHTSEESSFSTPCASGFAVDGMRCKGGFCDNVAIHCKRVANPLLGAFFPPGFTSPDTGTCGPAAAAPTGFLSALDCEGSSCTALHLRCNDVVGGPSTATCYESPLISEENDNPPISSFTDFSPDGDHYVTSVRCIGNSCDDKILTLCPERLEDILAIGDGRCIAYDSDLDSVVAFVCPDVAAAMEEDPDRFFEVDASGRIRQQFGTECIGVVGAPAAGAVLSLEPCATAETWTLDAWNRLRSVIDPSLCMDIEEGGQTTSAVSLQACKTASAWLPSGTPPAVRTPPPSIFVSEYVESSGAGKALEIFNGTPAPVDLFGMEIHIHPPETGTLDHVVPLSGTLQPGEVLVVVRDDPGTDPALTALADLLSDDLVFSGDDPIELYSGIENRILDAIGQRDVQVPAFSDQLVTAQDRTLRRRKEVCVGDVDSLDEFLPSQQWVEHPVDSYGGLGQHAVQCEATQVPIPGIAGVFTAAALGWTGIRRISRAH